MAIKKEDILEIEKSLKDASLIEKSDTLEMFQKGDYWEKILFINSQVRGYYYFTKKSIVFIGGALSSTQVYIPYENVKSIKKYNVAFFMPTGIKIEAFDEKKGCIVKHKMSVLKRNDLIKYMEEKMRK